MKVALVYDRVNKWGGAERILLALHNLFPDAPLFTTVYDPVRAPWASVFTIHTSFLQNIPGAKGNHEFFPFLSTIAFEQFSFDQFDLVISVTSAEAKGIINRPGTTHICYCLTPTRYLWSHYDEYFRPGMFRSITKPIVRYMKQWDLVASSRPDHYIAISNAVRDRIKKYYHQNSNVIYPLVKRVGIQTSLHLAKAQSENLVENNFLIVSRLVSYKKVDVAIEAFNELGLPLVIVGKGREEARLKSRAKSNITFIHDLTDDELSCYYRKSRALVMVQEEDFGLTAVEAQAHGIPVIAYKSGGVLDTVVDQKTGIFFEKQTKNAVKNAIIEFQKQTFSKEECMKNATRFSEEKFKKEFMEYVTHNMEQKRTKRALY